MRVVVVGGGAREDALSWRIAQSPSCDAIFAAPGNAGTATRGENWPIAATDGKAIAQRCLQEKIDLAVIGPESAIAAGVGDQLRKAGLPTFGPDRSAGRLESSKIFAKRFLQRYGIPTARAAIVHSLDAALHALDDWRGACVVKADGLAAGKGVVVADDTDSAKAVLRDWYGHNRVPGGGAGVLLEERLEGRELSAFAIGDGHSLEFFAAACDYKRAGDGDTGPNTGGMGAYSPPAGFPGDAQAQIEERIITPVLNGLREEGERYIGTLYCGLMWTGDGPYVIEFNVRFGDPEAQVLMPRIEGDFARFLQSAANGRIDASSIAFSEDACVGVVLATAEYPRSSTPLRDLPTDLAAPKAQIFWGTSSVADGAVSSPGGRVLTVAATGDGLEAARARAYAAVAGLAARLSGAPLTYRKDIALQSEPLRTAAGYKS